MVKTGIDAMLNTLDPYTNYITESDIEEYVFQTTGKYGGIGANMSKRGDKIIISDIYQNSPVDKAGLKVGDELLSVNGQSVKNKTTEDIYLLFKGSIGTQYKVQIKDAFTSQQSEKNIVLSEIQLSSLPYVGLVGKDNNVAYVHLSQFTPMCSNQVRKALDSLKKVQPALISVVLDLRGNPGGLLNEAVSICNLFIDKGQLVVKAKGKIPETSEDFKTTQSPWDLQIPVAVLVNQSSASASEVVAGTLQDLDRAVIIGQRSYGKGLVQITKPVGYNARLKVTIAKYYTPSGRCIQAIDYSHRNADGSVGHIPDSLKKEYKTKTGRRVLSGGGVEPDFAIEDEDISKLAITLHTKYYLFDYATAYAKEHKTIASASTFALNDNDFAQFTKWLDGKDYSYKTDAEIALDSFKASAVSDKTFDNAKTEYNALLSKISHDKKQDLVKHKHEIARLLESEIVSRYYFLRGRIENNLKDDKDLEKALAILSQPPLYKATLTTIK
jgi:carboxyl-terminal processing protease